MSMTGMDIDGVRTLARQMSAAADEINTLMHNLTTALQNTNWVGADQQHFVGEWQGQHCSALSNVSQQLTDAATKATRNADEQQAASNN